jgi:hypothetical protein
MQGKNKSKHGTKRVNIYKKGREEDKEINGGGGGGGEEEKIIMN